MKKHNNRGGNIDWKDSELTIKDLIEWNAGYFNKTKLSKDIISEKNEKGYYTDLIDNNKSILDIFFLESNHYLILNFLNHRLELLKYLMMILNLIYILFLMR